MFYTTVGNTFLFASEMKALLAHPHVPRELDDVGLHQICTFWHAIPPRTIFRGLAELPPAHALTVAHGRVALKPYWTLAYGNRSNVMQESAAEELAALLEDATRLRLRGDVSVGAYVSGGLDSSMVSAIMRELIGNSFKTFSLRFEGSALDEGNYQKQIVRHIESDHHELHCSNADIARRLPHAMWHLEQPIVRLAPVPLVMLSGLARSAGCKVVMTGKEPTSFLGGMTSSKNARFAGSGRVIQSPSHGPCCSAGFTPPIRIFTDSQTRTSARSSTSPRTKVAYSSLTPGGGPSGARSSASSRSHFGID